MKNYTFLLLMVIMGITTINYTQEEQNKPVQSMTEKMKAHTEKTRAQWNYNPFRKSDTEKKLVGWLDPYSFISSLWIGDILSKYRNFPDPNWNLDKAYIFYSMKIATEINPISFTIKDFTFRLGVAYSAEIQLVGYEAGFSHLYGQDIMISDYMRINMHFDFIWNDKLKFRWTPMVHECSHISGDYQADHGFDPDIKQTLPDLSLESMMFELFYNWEFFTFYSRINFTYGISDTSGYSAYATLFGFSVGTDVRIPIWGQINFIAGFHFGMNYDLVRDIVRNDSTIENGTVNNQDTLISETKKWCPVIAIGLGFEFDRFIIGAKYSRMRSRHLVSHLTIDERIGIDLSIFF